MFNLSRNGEVHLMKNPVLYNLSGSQARRRLMTLSPRWITSTHCGRGKRIGHWMRWHSIKMLTFSWWQSHNKANPGPTTAKGQRAGTWKSDVKPPISSSPMTLLRKSKFWRKKITDSTFLLQSRGTYSEFTYTVAISWLEHVLNDNFDNLLKKYVFDPLGMAG